MDIHVEVVSYDFVDGVEWCLDFLVLAKLIEEFDGEGA